MKRLKITKPFWQVVGLGTLAGMRTMSAPAVASHILSQHQSKGLDKSPLRFMKSSAVAGTLKVLAVAELIGDKMPKAGNRTRTGGLVVRCLAGSLAGASIYKATGNNPYLGALIGSVSAFAATYGSFYLRKSTVAKTKIFDPVIGAIEDALVIGAGVGLAVEDE